MRRAWWILFVSFLAWGDCPEAVVGLAAGDVPGPESRVLEAYERLLAEAGAGILTEGDLRRLQEGDPFDLEPGARVEALPIAEGLRGLGDFVREKNLDVAVLRPRILRALSRRLETLKKSERDLGSAVSGTRAITSVYRDVVVGTDIRHLVLSGDGKRLAVLPRFEQPIRIFEIDGTFVGDVAVRGTSNTLVAFNDDGSLLLTVGHSGARAWRVGPAAQGGILPLGCQTKGRGQPVGFVDNGRAALFMGHFSLSVMDVATGRLRNRISTDPLDAAQILPDGRVAVFSDTGEVEIYDDSLWRQRFWGSWFLRETRPRRQLPDTYHGGMTSSRDGGRLFTHVDSTVFVWSREGEPLHTWNLPDDVAFVAPSPAGQRFAVTFYNRDLEVYETATGTRLASMPAQRGFTRVYGLRSHFLEEDLLLVCAPALSLWNLDSGETTPLMEDSYLPNAVWDPTGRRMLVPDGDSIRVWNLGSHVAGSGL